MTKKFITAVIVILLAFSLVAGTAFAYWYVNESTTVGKNTLTLLVDDIEENYLFGGDADSLFVKIFANNPEKTENGFVQHSGTFDPNENTLIFRGDYLPDSFISANDLSAEESEGTLASNLNAFIGSVGYDIRSVILRDHVTGCIVGWYEETAAEIDDGNYYAVDGKMYGLTFENFSVRKNYIFYVDTIN